MQKQLSAGLNARQMKALQENAPSAEDILNNPEFMEELNQEVEGTYGTAPKAERPKTMGAIMPVERPVRKLPQPTVKALDPEAELEEMNRQAEAKLAKRREEEAARKEEVPVPQEVSPEEALRAQIVGALQSHERAPSEADIVKWKREHGENGVYVLALNEDDVFVFTYLRRGQWQKIQQAVANAQKAELTQNPDDTLKEKVLQFTVLWPRPLTIEFFTNSRAGTIDTLFNVIMANSSFLQLSQAMILTTQL
jgi:hypothetical protein